MPLKISVIYTLLTFMYLGALESICRQPTKLIAAIR